MAETVEFAMSVPTDISYVEDVVDLVARRCVELGVNSHAARFNLRVALSEALANAIIYGNEYDQTKNVDVTLRVSRNRVTLEVEDEGSGFDPMAVPDPTLPERVARPDGRGLFLIRNLVDEVSFSEKGNSICMILRQV